jgi:hypothetical protein
VKVYTSAQSLINCYNSRAHGHGWPEKQWNSCSPDDNENDDDDVNDVDYDDGYYSYL